MSITFKCEYMSVVCLQVVSGVLTKIDERYLQSKKHIISTVISRRWHRKGSMCANWTALSSGRPSFTSHYLLALVGLQTVVNGNNYPVKEKCLLGPWFIIKKVDDGTVCLLCSTSITFKYMCALWTERSLVFFVLRKHRNMLQRPERGALSCIPAFVRFVLLFFLSVFSSAWPEFSSFSSN